MQLMIAKPIRLWINFLINTRIRISIGIMGNLQTNHFSLNVNTLVQKNHCFNELIFCNFEIQFHGIN